MTIRFNTTNRVSIEELHELFAYDPDTGIIRWKVSPSCAIRAGRQVSGLSTAGYIRVKVRGRTYLGHHVAWALTYGEWPTSQIDHKDRNPENNRITNLRQVTDSQQQINRILPRCSPLKGVRQQKNHFRAEIRYRGRSQHIGSFKTPLEAALAYDAFAIRAHGADYPTNKSLGLI